MPYDDEGTLIRWIQSYIEGAGFYSDRILSYGPAYYAAYGFIFDTLGIPLTTDGIRLNTIFFWFSTAGLSALSIFRLTGSVAFSIVGFTVTCAHLYVLSNEPAHPQEFIVLCLSALILCATYRNKKIILYNHAVEAFIIAALLLTKINVGIFAALGFFIAFSYSQKRKTFITCLCAYVGVITALILPWALMSRDLTNLRVFFFAALVCLSVGVLTVATENIDTEDSPGRLLPMIGFFALSMLMICTPVFIRGATPKTILDSLFLRPMLLYRGSFLWPYGLSNQGGIYAALMAAMFFLIGAKLNHRFRETMFLDYVQIAAKTTFGIFLIALPWETNGTTNLLNYATPFLGLLLVPPFFDKSQLFARVLLCWVALLQVLIAYPIAGSQLFTGTYLFLVAGCICLGDVAGNIASSFRNGVSSSLYKFGIPLSAVFSLGSFALLILPLNDRYKNSVSYQLPGAYLLRGDEYSVATMRWLTENLKRHSTIFTSNVGLNSLYRWANQESPNAIILNWQQDFYSEDDHRSIIDALRTNPRSAFIYHAPFSVSAGSTTDEEPFLVRGMRKYFRDRGSVNGFHFYTLAQAAPPELVSCAKWISPTRIRLTVGPGESWELASIGYLDVKGSEGIFKSNHVSHSEISRILVLDVEISDIDPATRVLRLFNRSGDVIGLVPFLD